MNSTEDVDCGTDILTKESSVNDPSRSVLPTSRRLVMAYVPLTFVLVGVNLSVFSTVSQQAIPALHLDYRVGNHSGCIHSILCADADPRWETQ
jgi:hypothetical protein